MPGGIHDRLRSIKATGKIERQGWSRFCPRGHEMTGSRNRDGKQSRAAQIRVRGKWWCASCRTYYRSDPATEFGGAKPFLARMFDWLESGSREHAPTPSPLGRVGLGPP